MSDDESSAATQQSPQTTRRDSGTAAAGDPVASWPVELRGVTETVVATLGPNELYNQAALGIHDGAPVTARTWGRTRTWRNFQERGWSYVQFTADPVAFVEAALGVYETDEPILTAAAAWVRVDVEPVERGQSDGTQWVEWQLSPTAAAVREKHVPTTNRGYGAVIEATVAASRLDVDAYDTAALLDRLEFLESVVERAGGDAERQAFERLSTLVPWRDTAADR